MWAPGGGGLDVLSSGRDDGPGRWERRRVVAVAAVCLLIGALVGLHFGTRDAERGAAAASTGAVSLQAGGMEEVVPCARRCLRLPVFNAGRRPASVRAVAFAGWRVRLDTRPVRVPPGSWADVRVGLVADCRDPRPSRSGTVQVQAAVGRRVRLLTLALPHPVDLIRADYDRHCPVGPPATPQDLRGVWVLESASGFWHDLGGTLLMRFAADGTFAWESTGHLFDSTRSDGGYELRGRRLSVTVDTLTACHATLRFTWRVTLTAPDELNMRLLRAGPRRCLGRGDEVWLAHRMLLDHRLPEMRAIR